MAEISMNLLNSVSGIADRFQNQALTKQTESGANFAGVLSDMLQQYNEVDHEGNRATLNLLSGNTDDLSSTLIATEKAEIALSLTVAIRNKAVDAYKEIMNMQI